MRHVFCLRLYANLYYNHVITYMRISDLSAQTYNQHFWISNYWPSQCFLGFQNGEKEGLGIWRGVFEVLTPDTSVLKYNYVTWFWVALLVTGLHANFMHYSFMSIATFYLLSGLYPWCSRNRLCLFSETRQTLLGDTSSGTFPSTCRRAGKSNWSTESYKKTETEQQSWDRSKTKAPEKTFTFEPSSWTNPWITYSSSVKLICLVPKISSKNKI